MHYSACIKYPLCDLTLLVGQLEVNLTWYLAYLGCPGKWPLNKSRPENYFVPSP